MFLSSAQKPTRSELFLRRRNRCTELREAVIDRERAKDLSNKFALSTVLLASFTDYLLVMQASTQKSLIDPDDDHTGSCLKCLFWGVAFSDQ